MEKSAQTAEVDSGLVKLAMMTNVFFNNYQHEIKVNSSCTLNR